MVSRRITAISIAALMLVLITMLVNTAFGKSNASALYVSSVDNIDIRIMESTYNCSTKHTKNTENAVSSINETISNITPGDKIALSYKIVNLGCIDVLLDGVDISIDNQNLDDYLTLKWTITHYKDSKPVNTISNCTNGQTLSDISSYMDVSQKNIIMKCDRADEDFCLLELYITFDENAALFQEVQQTVFTITPSFIQN